MTRDDRPTDEGTPRAESRDDRPPAEEDLDPPTDANGDPDDHEPIDGVTTLDTSTGATVSRAVKDAIARPRRLLRELNRLYHMRFHTRSYNETGVDVFAEDWDTLVVLDACRFDMFEEHCPLPGRLESRVSRGSSTYEFFLGNVDGRTLLDTVYVTANPRFFRRRADLDTEFHAVVNVWSDGWDEDERTVLPETMTEYAVEAAREYPNKRLVVHYMQPHYPFVSSNIDTDEMTDERKPSVWDLVMTGQLDAERVKRDFVENLRLCVPHVERLLEELDGRTVVTADHGNMLGERTFPIPFREWGHPVGIYTEELVRVPWLVHETGSRRRIRSDTAGEETDVGVSETVLEDRLEQLGYRT